MLLLYAVVRGMRMRTVVEIGGLSGYSALNFLQESLLGLTGHATLTTAGSSACMLLREKAGKEALFSTPCYILAGHGPFRRHHVLGRPEPGAAAAPHAAQVYPKGPSRRSGRAASLRALSKAAIQTVVSFSRP